MSLWDDLGNFGSGVLDSIGEGFDNLVTTASTPTQSVNPNTQRQVSQEADNHGNATTTPQYSSNTKSDKTLLYVGGGVLAVLSVAAVVAIANK